MRSSAPLNADWQFRLFDLFRITTVASVISAIVAAIWHNSTPVVWDRGQIPWYYWSFAFSLIMLNVIVLPLLFLGVWGLLSDMDRRFRRSAVFFNSVCVVVLGARLLLFPLIHDRPLTPFIEHLAVFILGFLVPGLATIWLVRREGYRLVLLPEPFVTCPGNAVSK